MNQPDPDAELKAKIQAIYNEHEGRYGYRRIRDELANRGQKVNHKNLFQLLLPKKNTNPQILILKNL